MQTLGGFFTQGKTDKEASRLMNDAKSISQAGAFSMVIEAIPEEVASDITQSIEVPTIGIGAGNLTDGQVLVLHDLLGMKSKEYIDAKFVKRYGGRYGSTVKALKNLKIDGDKSLFVTSEKDQNTFLSSRNLKNAKVITADKLNTYDILYSHKLIISENAFDQIEKLFKV